MIFNVVITKRKRNEYIEKCLYYLNEAAVYSRGKHDINVYVAYDDIFEPDTKLKCLNIFSIRIDCNLRQPFHKTRLLNDAHKRMTENYDFLITLDNDIIVKKDFFKQINLVCSSNRMCFLGGIKLTESSTEKIIHDRPDIDDIFNYESQYGQIIEDSRKENRQQAYIGNIALHRKMVEKIKTITAKDELYDERFIGFGGEDSVLSYLSRDLEVTGFAIRAYLPDAWRHMYHRRNTDNPYYNENVRVMESLINYNRKRIQETIQKRNSK
jgi:hypothetical protein